MLAFEDYANASSKVGRITELLRSGASLTETRELARHSDVRMTMRYTHIGLDDQAKAILHLPVPGSKDGSKDGRRIKRW